MFSNHINKPEASSSLNLRRLFAMRNLTIAGAIIAVASATLWLHIELPLLPLGIIISLLIGLNLLTWLRLQQQPNVTDREFFIQLLIDVGGITGILYYTGGASNPFAWFFLLPLIVTATVLPRIFTWSMAGLTIACYTFLLYFHVPLTGMSMTHEGMSHDGGFQLHVFGMWFGFMLSAGFVAYFIVEMAYTLRKRDQLLADAREEALRNDRLVALGTLAAGAAHELGTPLGTMAILASELENDYAGGKDPELREKLQIMSEQVERCKEALSVISASAGEVRAEGGHSMPVRDYLDGLIEQWRGQRHGVRLEYRQRGDDPSPLLLAERTLSQALMNILDNAADASPEHVDIEARWDKSQLVLEISDRGPGLSRKAATAIGDRPVTTKDQGMGVGLLLAHATISRLGGSIEFFNREECGACIRITLPLYADRRDHPYAFSPGSDAHA